MTKMIYRSTTVGDKIDVEARTVEVAFSSETPYERYYGYEILDHDSKSIRLGRLLDGGPVLVDHNSADHVGVIESVQVGGDKVGRAKLRFGKSARASEIFQDVVDGIRKSISVGYIVHTQEITQKGKNSPDTYRVTDWEPLEISFVAVPADASVGVGRHIQNEEDEMDLKDLQAAVEVKSETKIEEKREVDVQLILSEERKRISDNQARINKIGESFGEQELARQYMVEQKSADELIDAINLKRQKETKPVKAEDLEIGMSQKDISNYSLLRAISAADKNDWSKAGFEREINQELANKMGRDARGFYLPMEIFKRVMSTSDLAKGGATVQDEQFGPLINALVARTVLGQLGATMLPGLVGDMPFPKITSTPTAYWISENGDTTDSDVGTGNVVLAPKTVSASTKLTRKLLKQSALSVEQLVLNELIGSLARAIDSAGLSGTGNAGQPKGILNQTGVNTQTVSSAGNPTWAETVGFEAAVDTDNALLGSLAYVTTPAVAGAMKVRAKDSGSGLFVLDGGTANGYPVLTTTALAANTILFGDFSSVMIGMWGVMDIRPDAATAAASDGLFLRVFQDVDVAVRYPESFCKNA